MNHAFQECWWPCVEHSELCMIWGHDHGNPAVNIPSPSILRKMRVLESALPLRQLCDPFLGKMSSYFPNSYSWNLQFCSFYHKKNYQKSWKLSQLCFYHGGGFSWHVHPSLCEHLRNNICIFFAFSSIWHLLGAHLHACCYLRGVLSPD